MLSYTPERLQPSGQSLFPLCHVYFPIGVMVLQTLYRSRYFRMTKPGNQVHGSFDRTIDGMYHKGNASDLRT